MAIQPDGKIIVAGSADDGISPQQFLIRVTYDGTLDTDFGAGTGWVRTEILDSSTAHSVFVQADGKIVTTGTADGPNGSYATAVRYNADGSLDATFNAGD